MAVAHRWMNGNDRGMDNDLYKDFLEIFPLMETFMEHRKSRQASLIVTPAPVRHRPDRKLVQKLDVVNSQSKEDNRPRRSKPGLSDDNHIRSQPLNHYMPWNGCDDPELSQRQSFQDMLKEVSQESNSVPVGTAASQQYSDEFVQGVLEENNRLRAILKNGPWDVAEISSRMAVAEELGALRSQVAALNHMVDAEACRHQEEHFAPKADASSRSGSSIWSGEDSQALSLELIGKADRARREYLAAVIAARVCKEESLLILVAELRLQLQLLLVQI